VCEELEEATVVLYTISSSAANPKQNLLGSFCSIVELLSVLLILHSKKHAFTDDGKICCGWGSLASSASKWKNHETPTYNELENFVVHRQLLPSYESQLDVSHTLQLTREVSFHITAGKFFN
jgi:hypothetical protein